MNGFGHIEINICNYLLLIYYAQSDIKFFVKMLSNNNPKVS